MDKNNRCWMCGEQLDENNCRPHSKSYTEMSFMCINCESEMFDNLAKFEGRYMALYHICAMLDIPVKPIVLDGIDFDKIEQPFITYINLLEEKKMNVKKGKLLGFKDGITDLRGVFGKSLSHADFAACIENEKKKIQKDNKDLCGTEEQREKWGELPIFKGLNWTSELYDECDRQYEIRAAEFRGQTISPQMDDTLIKVAKANILYDHLMRQGLVKQALDVQKGIDLLLASEEMRKKDAKKQENFRIDSQIIALEKNGMYESGGFKSYEDTAKAILNFAQKPQKYQYTLDVADQMILDFYNHMRANQDLPTATELPEDLEVIDDFGEFAEIESKEEKAKKRFAGLTKVSIDRNQKED